jgi:hypothetical protein
MDGGSAPFWEKNREIIRQMFAPVTQAYRDALIGSRHTFRYCYGS